ncbi:hypothetical protein LX36DRAFT_746955 [Colletotrichum falcatum]|nr:hypothetical protein LX36DRAFT_746955 [Colletotrichum falcatum]
MRGRDCSSLFNPALLSSLRLSKTLRIQTVIMKTFVTALVAFGTVAVAQEVTVSCAGISSSNVNPCSVVSGGKFDVSSGFCCVPEDQVQAYSNECVLVQGLSFSKIADGCSTD